MYTDESLGEIIYKRSGKTTSLVAQEAANSIASRVREIIYNDNDRVNVVAVFRAAADVLDESVA